MTDNQAFGWLPAALLATPLAFAALVWLAPARLRKALSVLSTALSLLLSGWQAYRVVCGGPIASLDNEVLVDGLAAIMALLISFMAFACSIYALSYLPGVHPREP